jgi:hypothetical protein
VSFRAPESLQAGCEASMLFAEAKADLPIEQAQPQVAIGFSFR